MSENTNKPADKVEEKETGAIPTADALAANEESNESGENTAGVLSPDPKTGAQVPSELIMPNEVIDNKTGEVMKGSQNPTVATPRPNPKAPDAPQRPEDGQEWPGNHTV